jgi:hypothetical protein
MRPRSIVMFERLFLASLVVSAVSSVLVYNTFVADPAMQELGFGTPFLVGAFAFSFGLYLLLWFLIARKASNIAKWILVVFLALGVVSYAASLTIEFTPGAGEVLGLLAYVLEVAAVVFLFRTDAADWFAGHKAVDPTIFD